ncbi:DUF1015 family protein [Lactiplantibacillus dongliensis]|uniref:DUF1015 family protein n=1 Tax=Lactiplantibacillus dongliensis TaxID=2559919 RepID=A0ABW1R1I3_9LACO|nr:DUF1015 family protein [Lactiplantibacillus dongliensis]
MQLKPFTAILPTTSGLKKITSGTTTDWTAADEQLQTTPAYYWYELTSHGIHQWRLLANWTAPATVTTMAPAAINTVLYPQQPVIEMLIDDWVGHFPKACDVTDPAGTTHRLWQITDADVLADITETMAAITPRKTWLTTTPTPLVMLVAEPEWTKFDQPLTMPAHLIRLG